MKPHSLISNSQKSNMAHNIYISNLSKHDQTFEVHGWNDNKNLTVNGGKTAIIRAPDHSSGAIIAVHDGHEGEQAEITKGGGKIICPLVLENYHANTT